MLATFLLVALFALSALAVDVGFLYTRSRMIHAVADSAVAAGMGDIVAGNTAAATTDVNNLAAQYNPGTYTITPTPTASQLSVTVSATYPLYFAKIFGLNSKVLTVTAIGKKGIPTPALLALGTACGSGVGVTINGSGGMTVKGDVDSNGILDFGTGPPGAQITGSAQTLCAGGPLKGGTPGQWPWDTVTGTYGSVGSPFADPFAPFTPPTCTWGTLTSGGDPTAGHWTLKSGVTYKLDPGVYCTTSNLTANGPGQGVDATGVTFVLMGGTLQIGVNVSSTFSAAAGSPNNIIAYTSFTGSCSAGPAINIGGPAGALYSLTMTGSFYAPNGCINAGSNSATTLTGSFIGNEVELGTTVPGPSGPAALVVGPTGRCFNKPTRSFRPGLIDETRSPLAAEPPLSAGRERAYGSGCGQGSTRRAARSAVSPKPGKVDGRPRFRRSPFR